MDNRRSGRRFEHVLRVVPLVSNLSRRVDVPVVSDVGVGQPEQIDCAPSWRRRESPDRRGGQGRVRRQSGVKSPSHVSPRISQKNFGRPSCPGRIEQTDAVDQQNSCDDQGALDRH